MSRDEDTEMTEKELQDYVEGKDAVSAAYQALGKEQPSPELDAGILQKARDSVKEKTHPEKVFPYQRYSIAASVFLSVIVVSLYLNNEAEFTAINADRNSLPIAELQVIAPTAGDAGGVAASDANANAASPALAGARQLDALEASVERSEAIAIQVERPADERAEQLNAVLDDGAASQLRATAQGAGGEIQELELRATFFAADADFSTDALLVQPAPDYRISADLWLLEIQRLLSVGEDASVSEERSLFAAAYPDIDIDAALADLETDN